jgi:alanine racemase
MNNHVTVLEIDGNALLHNLHYFKQKLQPETKIMVVVKAFGYGSDAIQVAKFLEHQVDYYTVAYAHEGIALREAGVKTPILVLHPQIQNLKAIVDFRLEPNLYNFKIFNAFLKLADEAPLMNYPIHLKFNTGLNRLGFWHTDVPKILTELKKTRHVKVQSLFLIWQQVKIWKKRNSRTVKYIISHTLFSNSINIWTMNRCYIF